MGIVVTPLRVGARVGGLLLVAMMTLGAQQTPQTAPGRTGDRTGPATPSKRPAPAKAASVGRAAAQRPGPFVKEGITKKVSDHVWVIPDQRVSLVPNVGIVVGSRATLVIDPGMGARNGQAVLREVAKVSKNTELYVASTHFHTEHASGVAAFPASAKYIVCNAQQKDLEELAPRMAELLASRSPVNADLLKGAQFRKPDVTFDTQYELDLGGVKATLMALGPTHTRGDTAIWVQDGKEGVIFAGDIVMNRTIVAYGEYSSTKAWMEALAQLAKLRPQEEEDAAVLVPSHGPMGDADLIAYQRGFFQGVQARVQQMKEDGKSGDEIVKAVTDEFKDRYKIWNATDRIEAIVRNIYKEM